MRNEVKVLVTLGLLACTGRAPTENSYWGTAPPTLTVTATNARATGCGRRPGSGDIRFVTELDSVAHPGSRRRAMPSLRADLSGSDGREFWLARSLDGLRARRTHPRPRSRRHCSADTGFARGLAGVVCSGHLRDQRGNNHYDGFDGSLGWRGPSSAVGFAWLAGWVGAENPDFQGP